jgi:polar amino acid transport system substrate-binding protein
MLCAASMLIVAAFPAVAQTAGSAGPVSPEIVKDLAPTGKLRAAINLGNAILAQGSAQEPRGLTVDLARELARRTGLALELVTFPAAGKVFEALTAGAWDIAFIAIEPVRAAEIDFSPPYVFIEGTYMVPKDSPLKEVADVDRPGVRIAVGRGSAYDLFLTRTIRHATVVRAHIGGGRAMIDLFVAEKLEAVAGVKQPLIDYAKTDASVRVMEGRFMVIEQAMGTPKGRRRSPLCARLRRGDEGVGLRRGSAATQQPAERPGCATGIELTEGLSLGSPKAACGQNSCNQHRIGAPVVANWLNLRNAGRGNGVPIRDNRSEGWKAASFS